MLCVSGAENAQLLQQEGAEWAQASMGPVPGEEEEKGRDEFGDEDCAGFGFILFVIKAPGNFSAGQ